MKKNKTAFEIEYRWKDRKRPFLGLPISFTKYALSDDRLFLEQGLFTTVYDEVRLYRILDLKLTQTLGQKMFGIGTITVFSSDKAQGQFELKHVKHPRYVKELLSDRIEKQRDAKRVINRELMGDANLSRDDDMYDFDDEVDAYTEEQ